VKRARIVIRDLAKTFRGGGREVAAVHDVAFEVFDQEFVAIMGLSGCGKSTILNRIGGLVRSSAGAVEIDGVPVTGAAPPQVGYVFQKDTVYPWRTVARNIAVELEHRGVPRPARERRVRETIALAGLTGFEDAFPATLSGGIGQRVALMRTLVVEPQILLMDEPFGAIDTHTKINLHAELLALWEVRRQTVVFVTHDLSEAITLADRVVVMTRRPGRVKLVHEVALPRPRDVIALRERPGLRARVRRRLARPRRGIRGARPVSDRARVWLWPLVILVALLGAWEWLTGIKAISRPPGLYWIDPFFVSRPSLILAVSPTWPAARWGC
jgi:NitT/TauT family transport system ATP-binding protein